MEHKFTYVLVAPCDVDVSDFRAYFNGKEFNSVNAIKLAIGDFIKTIKDEEISVKYSDFQILSIDYFLDDLNSDCIDIDNSWVTKVIVVEKEPETKEVELEDTKDKFYTPVCLSGGNLYIMRKSNEDILALRPVSKAELEFLRKRERTEVYCKEQWKRMVVNDETTISLAEHIANVENEYNVHTDKEAFVGKMPKALTVFKEYPELRKIADDYANDNPVSTCDVATWVYVGIDKPSKSKGDIVFNKHWYDMSVAVK